MVEIKIPSAFVLPHIDYYSGIYFSYLNASLKQMQNVYADLVGFWICSYKCELHATIQQMYYYSYYILTPPQLA